MNHDHIIERFGTVSNMARAMKLRQSTVHYWHQKKKIPMWRWKSVIEAAKANHIEMNWEDFTHDKDRSSVPGEQ